MTKYIGLPLLLLACAGNSDDRAPVPMDSDTTPHDSASPEDTEIDPTEECEDPCTTASTAVTEQVLDPQLWSLDVERTRDNPLRGFMTSYRWSEPHNDLSHQLEYFYLPMADVWDADGETLDTGLEPHLEAAAARGHHAVIRVFIDYPNQESGMPDYLVDTVSCQTYEEFGGGCSPDYDDPLLVEAMLGLIEAMGARYDGDPRLGFLQLGLLGFWGEWHTWPHNDWFPTQETQTSILNAFDTAFQSTQMQVRLPYANSLSLRIGFHDDSFAYSTIGDIDWFFVNILESVGGDTRWQEVAIGGELRPELQGWVFDDAYEPSEYQQDFDECVAATHVTYLLNYSGFSEDGTGYVGSELERAEAAALTMGYQFELTGASLVASGLLEDSVEVAVNVELSQTGVAPFYYPLSLQLDSDTLDGPVSSAEDLRSVLPGERREIVFELGRVSVDVLNTPMTLSFVSEMLLEGQAIEMATVTPWDGDAGTVLEWTLRCESDTGETLEVGEIAGVDSAGCDCVCDVDGQIRACGVEACD